MMIVLLERYVVLCIYFSMTLSFNGGNERMQMNHAEMEVLHFITLLCEKYTIFSELVCSVNCWV